MILYVIRRKSDGYYHCMGGNQFCKKINKAKLYISPKTAIRHYYSVNGEYDNLEVVEIKIKDGLSMDITDELYKEYKNADYESYLRNRKSAEKVPY